MTTGARADCTMMASGDVSPWGCRPAERWGRAAVGLLDAAAAGSASAEGPRDCQMLAEDGGTCDPQCSLV